MKRNFLFLAMVFLLSSIPIQANETITLFEAISNAMVHNTSLKEERIAVNMVRSMVNQARLVPNPQVNVSVQHPDFETSLSVEQPIDIGGKQAISIRIAELTHEIAALNYRAKRLALISNVSQVFFDTFATQEQHRLIQSFLEIEENYYQRVLEKVLAGKASMQDQKRAGVQVTLRRLALQKITDQLGIQKRELSRLWGENSPKFELLPSNFWNLASPKSLETYQSMLSKNPTWEAQERSIVLAQSTAELAKSNLWSPVTLGAGIAYKQGSNQTSGILSIGFPLPIADQNQWKIEQSSLEINRATVAKTAIQLTLMQALEQRYSELQIAYREAQSLNLDIIPTLESIRKNAQEGYLQGKWPYTDVIDAQKSSLESKHLYLDIVSRYHQSLAQIDELTTQFSDKFKGDLNENN